MDFFIRNLITLLVVIQIILSSLNDIYSFNGENKLGIKVERLKRKKSRIFLFLDVGLSKISKVSGTLLILYLKWIKRKTQCDNKS